jgi:hypothetical protein
MSVDVCLLALRGYIFFSFPCIASGNFLVKGLILSQVIGKVS